MNGGLPDDRFSVEDVFKELEGRRSGFIKALVHDAEEVYEQCDPDKDELYLLGLPNGTWAIGHPVNEVPPDLPEPVLGINFSRDVMQKNDWLYLIAVHSDAWLISLVYFYAGTFDFDKAERNKLFNLVNSLPTLTEVVTGKFEKQPDGESSTSNPSRRKPESKALIDQTDIKIVAQIKSHKFVEHPEQEEQEESFCGACGEIYSADGFWICCDACENWYHGKCVKVTPVRAEHIDKYNCPSCSHKRARN